MQFKIVALSLLASLAAAETVQELTAELPSCAVTCINKAAQEQNCAADDQECKCKNATKIMEPAFECAADTCTANELDDSAELTSEICAKVLKDAAGNAAQDKVDSAVKEAEDAIDSARSKVGSATSKVGDKISEAGDKISGNDDDDDDENAAGRVGAGMGVVGAAALVVALAL